MSRNLQDISSETDIKQLVDSFYDLVVKDELLGPVFNDIAQVNWDSHLPKMYAFWSSMLLGGRDYFGQPFPVHAALSEFITRQHFENWLRLFLKTVDDLFEGEKADLAKTRAQNIAMVFQAKMGLLGQPGVAQINNPTQ